MRWAVLALFLPCQLALIWLDMQLDPGIIPFELAGTPARAQAILDGWGPEGQRVALIAHVVDYGYLVAYGLGLAIVAKWRDPRLVKLPLLAAGFDALENACLVAVLLSGPGTFVTGAAAVFAVIKFALLARFAAGLIFRRP